MAIDIAKQIPVAGGMAGGSADAAAALVGCAALWGLDMARGDLAQIGAEIGADVPFALTGGTAVGTGRGDLLSPVLARTPLHWVLALADEGLSTPEVFAELDRLRAAQIRAASRRGSVPVTGMLAALASGDPAAVAAALGNDLQAAAISLQPGLRRTLRAGLSRGRARPVWCPGPARPSRCCAPTPNRPAASPPSWPAPAPAGRCGSPPARRPGARVIGTGPGGQALMANLVNIEAASVTHGVRTVLDRVSLGVQTGDRIGVLGLNGSGKTTLLRLLAGLDAPDTGRVSSQRGTSVAFVSQSTDLPPESTVRDAVLHTFGDAEHAWAVGQCGARRAAGLGLRDIGLDSPVGSLSGGEQRRVSLGAALVTDADLLLLDEPTNHLDIEAVAWLADYLTKRSGAVVAVTHDRWFLDAVATTTWEVVDAAVLGREGGYSDWVFARAERLRLDQAAEERRKNLARKELAWLRRGPPARTSKPRYRIEAAEAIIAGEPEPRNTVELHAFARRRLGKDVLELEDVTAIGHRGRRHRAHPARSRHLAGRSGRPDRRRRHQRLRQVDPAAHPGRRAAARVAARSRSVRRCGWATCRRRWPNCRVTCGCWRRSRQIAGVVELGGKQLTAGQLAERFGFTNTHQWTRVAELSGGERRRLQLLRILMAEPNVLVLDEPTNDLDTDTLAALEDLLDSWPGTLLVVSHDRYLIERVADTVVALFGDGRITHLPGGVEEYLRRRAADQQAARPAARQRGGRSARRAGRPGGHRQRRPARWTRTGSARCARTCSGSSGGWSRCTARNPSCTASWPTVGADYAAAAEISVALKALQRRDRRRRGRMDGRRRGSREQLIQSSAASGEPQSRLCIRTVVPERFDRTCTRSHSSLASRIPRSLDVRPKAARTTDERVVDLAARRRPRTPALRRPARAEH